MQFISYLWDKRNYIILFVIICLTLFIIIPKKDQIYIKSFNYFDNIITYKIYDKVDNRKITSKINEIYKKYENYNNKLKTKLSPSMVELIEYGKLLYIKTDGYIDITYNNQENNFKTKINDVNIKNGKLEKKMNFNFDNIISSYATSEVLDYLKENDIKKYIINDSGDVITGKHYNGGKYKVSIHDKNSVLDILYLEEKAVATRRNDNKLINPKTGKIEKKYNTVIVIAKDNLTAGMLANAVYLMDKSSGEKLVHEYNAECLWQINSDIQTTANFNKYLSRS